MKFNFGDAPFDYPPQGGYKALSLAAKDAIVNSSASGKNCRIICKC